MSKGELWKIRVEQNYTRGLLLLKTPPNNVSFLWNHAWHLWLWLLSENQNPNSSWAVWPLWSRKIKAHSKNLSTWAICSLWSLKIRHHWKNYSTWAVWSLKIRHHQKIILLGHFGHFGYLKIIHCLKIILHGHFGHSKSESARKKIWILAGHFDHFGH